MNERGVFSLRGVGWLTLLLLVIFIGVPLVIKNIYGVEEAFKRTSAGKIEIKTIPASMVMVSESEGNYFGTRNYLFRRLFNYISENNVAMTTPVEARIENAQMKFYVGTKDKLKELKDRGSVKVVTIPQRTVVSIGIRGTYTESNFEKAKTQLEQWLRDNTGYQQAGAAYAVYWDGPFMPWFLKQSEVQIPVEQTGKQ
jgi:effector-binding domain-containing protein